MTDPALTNERITRAADALAAYDSETDAAPDTVIGALLDFVAVTDHVPAVLARAISAHARTQQLVTETGDVEAPETEAPTDSVPADVAEELAYAKLAAAVIASLLDEARHMTHITPMDVLGLAHRSYDEHTRAEEE